MKRLLCLWAHRWHGPIIERTTLHGITTYGRVTSVCERCGKVEVIWSYQMPPDDIARIESKEAP